MKKRQEDGNINHVIVERSFLLSSTVLALKKDAFKACQVILVAGWNVSRCEAFLPKQSTDLKRLLRGEALAMTITK
jgi:hypothetical protein